MAGDDGYRGLDLLSGLPEDSTAPASVSVRLHRRPLNSSNTTTLGTAMTEVDDGYGGVDLLSGLPDDVLSHILSFLTAQVAIRTKLLSPRWRHLYPSNPTLRFCTRDYSCVEEFVARVDKAMQQIGTLKLGALELFVDTAMHDKRKYAPSMDKWIRHACVMNVERILLHMDADYIYLYNYTNPYMLPFQLCNASEIHQLKHLDLHTCIVPPFTSLDAPIISLRTLSFHTVNFDQNVDSFEGIPSYCPNLQSLTFHSCLNLPSLRKLCGRLIFLKSLVVKFCKAEGFEIHDANLRNITYYGFSDNLSFKGLSCLKSLELVLFYICYEPIFLSSLPEEALQLQCLSICFPTYLKDVQIPYFRSPFMCLKRLTLFRCKSVEADFENLSRFFRAAPSLQNLVIYVSQPIEKKEKVLGGTIEWSKEWLERRLMHDKPKTQDEYVCEMRPVLSCLKEIEITQRVEERFRRDDVEFMITLLQSATSLEKMVLGSQVQDEELQRILARYKPEVNFVTKQVASCI